MSSIQEEGEGQHVAEEGEKKIKERCGEVRNLIPQRRNEEKKILPGKGSNEKRKKNTKKKGGGLSGRKEAKSKLDVGKAARGSKGYRK